MPVNPLPVLIPLVCAWATIAYLLFRWRKWAGRSFLMFTAAFAGMWHLNTGVQEWHVETIRVERVSDDGLVFLMTNRGERLTVDSPSVAVRLHGREGAAVDAVWEGTYDFGRLRAYHFQTVDGVVP